jgi:nicotinamide mononucleotide transporter
LGYELFFINGSYGGADMEIFSINNIFFIVLGYQMSYLEFFGTLLNLLSVILVVRNNIWTWPVGNVGVVVFAIIFYQIHLYSDLALQIYFLITGFYGWWAWIYLKRNGSAEKSLAITKISQKGKGLCWAIIAAGTGGMGYVMAHIHQWLPVYFPKPASFPFFDSLVAVMSFAANLLMAHKKIDCWYLWIAVDVFSIGLYSAKGVYFIALLYAIFLGLAIKGLINWKKLMSEGQGI